MTELAGIAGKRIVVTGGGGGLGSVLAAEFARLGASVLVCGRTLESLMRATDAIDRELGPGRAFATICNVREPESIEAMLNRAEETMGGVDGLVNNASGLFPIRAEQLTPNGFRAVVDTVLNGTWNVTSASARRWIDQSVPGAVVNVLTPYAWTGAPGIVHNAAAKGGVLTMTRTLSVEWGPHGVRVNAIAPGWMPVGGTADLVATEADRERLIGAIPIGRLLRPEETARAAAYLLSDDAAFITGTCLTIDGGHHLSKGLFEFVEDLPAL
jgi:NAD(P)-dependent dehydrogenase (short-subunit alcohol dehydrogenase family)